MKKRLISLILILVMTISLMPTVAFAASTDFAGGNGTENNPFLIKTKYHLDNVRNYLDAHFKLISDIDLEGYSSFLPIGQNPENAFKGSFNGNGFVVKNLHLNISSGATVYAGLFGYNKGIIKNVGVIENNISASVSQYHTYSYVGGIAGYNAGTIENCYNTGNLSSYTVSNESSMSNAYAGGIAGDNASTIKNCYNTGDISSKVVFAYSYAYSGGIVGDNSYAHLENCYNVGNVSATCTFAYCGTYKGAIAGQNNQGTVINCYFLDNIPTGIGGNNLIDPTIKCNNEELELESTFVGFDFDHVWTFDRNSANQSTPILRFPNGRDNDENEGVIDTPEISKVSISLNKSLAYNIKVSKISKQSNPKVVFTVEEKTITVTDFTIQDELFVFTLKDIGPQHMTDIITAELIIEVDGKKTVCQSYSTSISEYCINVVNQDNSYKKLVNAILNYGASAQIYKNYKTETLANRALSNDEKLIAELNYNNSLNENYTIIADPLASWKNYGLILDEGAVLKLTFKTTRNIKNLSVKVETQSSEQVVELDNCFRKHGNTYEFYFDDFDIHELDSVYLFTVCKDGIPISNTLSYSVESYAYKAVTQNDMHLKSIIHALMNYGYAAKDYIS